MKKENLKCWTSAFLHQTRRGKYSKKISNWCLNSQTCTEFCWKKVWCYMTLSGPFLNALLASKFKWGSNFINNFSFYTSYVAFILCLIKSVFSYCIVCKTQRHMSCLTSHGTGWWGATHRGGINHPTQATRVIQGMWKETASQSRTSV